MLKPRRENRPATRASTPGGVLDQHAQRVMHQTPSSTHSLSHGSSIMSLEAAPAGTIG